MQRTLPLSSPFRMARHANRPLGIALASPWPALAVLVVGMVLRGLLLDRPGLHPDEALYASWALRIADGSDPALLRVYVDKPPLVLYLLAGLFRLAGFDGLTLPDAPRLILAGRLAALLASGASLALLWLMARRVYGPRVALGALALIALSPLAVRLSPTLFTDPWLTLWILLGLWAALARRPWLAGIACGLAYATKQQALLFAPLLLAVFLLNAYRPMAPTLAQTVSTSRLTGAGSTAAPSSRWSCYGGTACVGSGCPATGSAAPRPTAASLWRWTPACPIGSRSGVSCWVMVSAGRCG